ncbi:hypothetical protein [Saccharothrix sp. 6-C]|uniref:hypothetical protein n=1 Tax=Saccharothrix sp. 6-C TaxID=2781735 RepID=UPI003FA76C59
MQVRTEVQLTTEQQARAAVLIADASAVMAVDPPRRALTGDAHLGRDVGDRAGLAALDQAAAAFMGQRALRWSADGSFCSADELVALLILSSEDLSVRSGLLHHHQRHDT